MPGKNVPWRVAALRLREWHRPARKPKAKPHLITWILFLL